MFPFHRERRESAFKMAAVTVLFWNVALPFLPARGKSVFLYPLNLGLAVRISLTNGTLQVCADIWKVLAPGFLFFWLWLQLDTNVWTSPSQPAGMVRGGEQRCHKETSGWHYLRPGQPIRATVYLYLHGWLRRDKNCPVQPSPNFWPIHNKPKKSYCLNSAKFKAAFLHSDK